MGEKINKTISCLLLVALILCTLAGEPAYSWTTEVYAYPAGHEILTKEGAYDASDYYRSNAIVDFAGNLLSGNLLSANKDYSKLDVIEAGWRKKLKRFMPKVASCAVATVGLAVATVASVAVITVAVTLPVIELVSPELVQMLQGLWNTLIPYYGTYNGRTKSLIAGARYQDLKELQPGSFSMDDYQKKCENQKFHFLRRNNQSAYNIDVMRDEIDNANYGIKYKGIIEPIITAHRAINAPMRHYNIGNYEKINVYADHFEMGRVLHTIQDGYAHTKRNDVTWVINDVMVYNAKGAKDYEHENMAKTLFVPVGSHDRVAGYDLGFLGIRGDLKSAAKEAKNVTRDILKLWKNRDSSWASITDNKILIQKYFEQPIMPWATIVNRVCAHR